MGISVTAKPGIYRWRAEVFGQQKSVEVTGVYAPRKDGLILSLKTAEACVGRRGRRHASGTGESTHAELTAEMREKSCL